MLQPVTTSDPSRASGTAAAVGRLEPRRFVLVGLVVLSALGAATFHRAVFLGQVFFDRDIHWVWQPQVESWVRAVAEGAWPVWDRSIAFGQPLAADPSAQIFYPLTWLNLMLQPWTYYTVFVLLHLVFSGLGAALLGRRLGLSAPSAVTCGAVWMLSGPFLSLANVYHHFTSAAWMPWALWAADRAGQSRSRRHATAWGGVLGVQLLGGSADMCLMTGLLSPLVLARHVCWRRPGDRQNRDLLAAALLALLLAIGLACAQWLPTLEVALRSARWSLPDPVRTFWSLNPWALVQALAPVSLHQLPLRPDLRAMLFGSREPFLLSIYLGLPCAALVARALSGPRARLGWLVGGVGVGAVLIAVGPHTPVYGLALSILPPLRMLRFPQKALVVLALCWALLVGLGLETERHEAASGRRGRQVLQALVAVLVVGLLAVALRPEHWLAGVLRPGLTQAQLAALGRSLTSRLLRSSVLALASLVVALIAFRRRPGVATAVLAGLVAADLSLAHQDLHRTCAKELFTYRPPLADLLRGDDHRRVYTHLYGLPGYGLLEGKGLRWLGREDAFAPSRFVAGWSPAASGALAVRSYLAPPIGWLFGLESSYDLDARGLYPTPLTRLVQLARVLEGTRAHVFLLRLGAVRFVTALHRVEPATLVEVAQEPGYFADPIRVFRVPDPLPRAFAVSGVRVADGIPALELLRDAAFDPALEVLLPDDAPARPIPGFSADVRIAVQKADRTRLETRLSHDGLVVLVDSFDPGWRVTVDGRHANLLRANVGFMAVRVPAGAHDIEFVYRPRALLVGLAFSLAAVGLLATLMLGRRSPAPSSVPGRGQR